MTIVICPSVVDLQIPLHCMTPSILVFKGGSRKNENGANRGSGDGSPPAGSRDKAEAEKFFFAF